VKTNALPPSDSGRAQEWAATRERFLARRVRGPAGVRLRAGMPPSPPATTCPWCGAEPLQACIAVGSRGWRLLSAPSRSHPSRLDEVS
jgi:hypothetical protein